MKDRKMPRMADQEFPERSQGGCLAGRELLEQCFSKEQVFIISLLHSLLFFKKIGVKKMSTELNSELGANRALLHLWVVQSTDREAVDKEG